MEQYNFFTMIDEPKSINGKKFATFKCVCGNEKLLLVYKVKAGRIKSCGCKQRIGKYQDNRTSTKLYNIWSNMKKRNKNIVYADWINSYDSFKSWAEQSGYQDGLVLFRKQHQGEYTPENCIFGTKSECNQSIVLTKKSKLKYKATSIKNYGVEHPQQSQEVKDAVKATNLKRYGVESHLQSEKIKKKIRLTNLKKYGNCIASKTNVVKANVKKNNLKKYGIEYPQLLLSVQEKIIATTIERYGRFPVMSSVSKAEKEIQSWLSSLGFEFNSTYKLVSPKQIDLYNEQLKIAIEYCGIYWHNNKSKEPRDSRYHYNKYKSCLDKGVRLFTIFDTEWEERKGQWKNLIMSSVGVCERRIFARKTEIKQVDSKTTKQFLNQYHIQGGKRSPMVSFGLYFDNELIGAMTLNRHHRNIKDVIVLDRLCYKTGVHVVGGASKLLSKCIEWAKNNNYSKMISWSDNRYSQGNVYEKIGFSLDCELSPDYQYVDMQNPDNGLISKQSMKEKEKDKSAMCRYGKIYDCGKKRYYINL